MTDNRRPIPLSEYIAKLESDPEKAAALAEARQYVKDRIAREGRDWMYEMFIPVQALPGFKKGS